jgi:hypothetical protein
MKFSRYGLGKFGAAIKVRRIDPKTGAVITIQTSPKRPSSGQFSIVRDGMQQAVKP